MFQGISSSTRLIGWGGAAFIARGDRPTRGRRAPEGACTVLRRSNLLSPEDARAVKESSIGVPVMVASSVMLPPPVGIERRPPASTHAIEEPVATSFTGVGTAGDSVGAG